MFAYRFVDRKVVPLQHVTGIKEKLLHTVQALCDYFKPPVHRTVYVKVKFTIKEGSGASLGNGLKGAAI